uniref:hypothetical protein n=1 Tax=Sulfitobacter sp. TaxID=1903071 RepID=UPI003F6D8F9E
MFDLATTLRQVGIRQRSLRSHCRLGRATELVFVLATGATVLIGGAAVAADIDWDAGAPADTSTDPATGGAGTWVEGGGTLLWNDGTNNVDFTANDNVTFGAANPVGTYDVTLGGSVTTTNLTFGATGVTITDATSGNTLSVVGQVILSGAGIGSFIKAPVTGNLATNVDTGSILNLSGTVSGTVQTLGAGLVDIVGGVGGLNSDAGTVRINGSGANTGAVTGTTTIDDSTVQVQSGSLSAASTVTVTGVTSVLDVDGGTVGAVTINSGTLDADG